MSSTSACCVAGWSQRFDELVSTVSWAPRRPRARRLVGGVATDADDRIEFVFEKELLERTVEVVEVNLDRDYVDLVLFEQRLEPGKVA